MTFSHGDLRFSNQTHVIDSPREREGGGFGTPRILFAEINLRGKGESNHINMEFRRINIFPSTISFVRRLWSAVKYIDSARRATTNIRRKNEIVKEKREREREWQRKVSRLTGSIKTRGDSIQERVLRREEALSDRHWCRSVALRSARACKMRTQLNYLPYYSRNTVNYARAHARRAGRR